MVDDPDIWRAADLLLKRHRADAEIVVAMRADELLAGSLLHIRHPNHRSGALPCRPLHFGFTAHARCPLVSTNVTESIKQFE